MAECAVWVGGLPVNVNEIILYDLFHKFGPLKNTVILRDVYGRSKQCGFVNFLSQEAAELAARKMNGCEILGQTVKTKGPRELLATRRCTDTVPDEAVNLDRKDFRGLTDCVFFMEGRQCSPKSGECPFRHCVAARKTSDLCDKWIKKQCTEVFCSKRHPKLIKNRSDHLFKVVPTRCPSHNAFKCTGECGFDDCSTHFMEQDALQEHVNRGREKKFTLMSSCSQCKAIFFSEEERQQHSCLNSTTEPLPGRCPYRYPSSNLNFNQSSSFQFKRNSPVMFTNASPQNLIKPQQLHKNPSASIPSGQVTCGKKLCDCSKNCGTVGLTNKVKETFCVCSSCGISYENSGDSLSDFDLSVDSAGIGGHKCPNSPSVRGLISDADVLTSKSSVTGSPSQASTIPEAEPIGVFWDIENCPVPRGKSASAVVQKIRREFFTGKREVEFMCVCDISKEKKEIIEELNKAQVTVVHINATSKNAADDKLRQSLRRFAQSYLPPATVILVSGDINFAAELSDLRHRHNFQVICLHNAQAQDALLACAHETKRFDRFTADLPVVFTPKAPEENGLSSELLVLNLPMGKDVAQVRNRLKKLSDNCGGKVVSISGHTSILRFPNPVSAARARRRMDKEDVFGSTIQVLYSTSSHHSQSPPKNKKTRPVENAGDSVKSRDTCMSPKSTASTPQKGKQDSSCALLDTLNIEDTIPATNTLKKEGKTSQTPTDESPDSGDSTEENDGKPGPSLLSSTAQQFVSHQTMFSNGSYTGIWPHSIYPNFMNIPTQGASFPGITPLAPPMMGAPHLTASWLASLHNFTVLDQQRGGVDLLVTNLDENVSKKELKKKLASVFREHCKVLSVILHSGEGIPLRAFVKVPKLSDARLAICKVHQKKIFNTCVTVNIATDKEKELCFLRCEVTSILKEAPLHFLPLNKFLSEFYEKCSRAFDMTSIGLIHDLVVLTGKPGNQAISLLTRAIGGVRVSVEPDQFAKDVHTLLKSCKGSLPLVSFAASYWLNFDKKIESNDQGSALLEVLNCVPNVKVSESLMVSWAKQALKHGGNVSKLLEFSKDLQELLQMQEEFKLPLSSLISEYQLWFEKKTPFDPAVYGFTSVVTLLEALPAVAEVTQQGKERWLVLSQRLKIKVFAKNVKMLLASQPDHAIALGNFVSTYMKYLGQKCKIATFGFSKLTDLIEAVPDIAKIQGTGDQRLICLVEKDKSSRPEKQSEKQALVKELKELLSSCENQRLPVATVLARYYQHFGRLLKIGDHGAQRLEDLVESLPSLQIIEISGEKYLTFPSKVTVQSLRKDLVELLEQQDGKFLPISRLVCTFRKHYNRKFPLGQAKFEEFLRCLEGEVKVKGSANDRILLLPLLPAKDKPSPRLQLLSDKITKLLLKYPGCRVAEFAFADIFLREYGQMLKPKDLGFTSMASLIQALGDVLEVQGSGNMAAVCLKHEHLLEEFSRRVIHVLTEQSDKSIPMSKFTTAYEELCNHELRVQNFGFASLEDMLHAVSPVVKVDTKEDKLTLTPLQTFAIEARDLLKHLRGCVSLNRFAPNFQQLYGRPCKASDYGYSRVSEVIDAVSNVAEIRGKGAEKMVVLVDGDNVSLLGRRDTEQMKAGTKDCGLSDSTSVTVEEEEEVEVIIDEKDEEDLIILDGEASSTFPDQTVTDDWLMAPVPETLPAPELQPAVPEPPPVGDLISFTEFDMEMLLEVLDDAGLSDSPGGDLTELLADSNELSGEYNGARSPQASLSDRLSPNGKPSSSSLDLKDLEFTFVSPARERNKTQVQASPSPRKGGVLFLSEVEADILSDCQPETEFARNLATSFGEEGVEKPVVQRKSSDENRRAKPRKFSAPKVKLAVNFRKTTNK
ncbi:meiosis regulator and mRNA stability factor 1-like [Stylophora pistillata]|nr:meiosis regulator and mRNA stability factor 1-like [Stylophora pistillata]